MTELGLAHENTTESLLWYVSLSKGAKNKDTTGISLDITGREVQGEAMQGVGRAHSS